MLSLLLGFIKNKLFTNSGVFLTFFVVLFAVFFFSNSRLIMSKLGFDSITSLSVSLAKTQDNVKQLKTINDKLIMQLDKLAESHTRDLQAIDDLQQAKVFINNAVTTVTKKKDSAEKSIVSRIERQTVYTEKTVTLPTQDIDKLSENNIANIQQLYAVLFPNELTINQQPKETFNVAH